jgi:hypothetical protein
VTAVKGSHRVTRAAERPDRRAVLPWAAAFWLVAGVLFLLFFAAAAPSPLYGVYQAQWRFSAITLTAVFAAYALLLLVTLLVFGSVSDYLGRRRVILAGLAMAAGACGLFLAAHGVGLPFAARRRRRHRDQRPGRRPDRPATRGQPPRTGGDHRRRHAGSGRGLSTSALAQYGPAPIRLIWWLLLGADLAAAATALAMPETASPRAGVLASLRPRVAVPRQARGIFVMALPCPVAVWMISGFYLSLGPSLAAQVLRSPDLLWGGLVIFLPNGTGTLATVAASGPAAMLAGSLALLSGAAVTLAALQTASEAVFLTGTAVAGAGLRHRDARHLPHHQRPGRSRPAGRADRRLLHRVLHRVQYPCRGRRGGHHPCRPAPNRPGLLRGDRRARRCGNGQPDLPSPLYRPALTAAVGGGRAARPPWPSPYTAADSVIQPSVRSRDRPEGSTYSWETARPAHGQKVLQSLRYGHAYLINHSAHPTLLTLAHPCLTMSAATSPGRQTFFPGLTPAGSALARIARRELRGVADRVRAT